MASTTIEMPAAAKAEDFRLRLLRSAPKNSWIALSQDETEIVAIGNTFLEADTIARESGAQNYLLTRIPDEWISRALLPVV